MQEVEMVDFKVGDKVRLTGEEWKTVRAGSPQYGDVYTVLCVDDDGDGAIVEDEWWAFRDNDDDDWTATVVERDGRVIPEALLPGDVIEDGLGRATVRRYYGGGRLWYTRDGRRPEDEVWVYGDQCRFTFVRPATPKPAEPSLQEQIQQMAKDMAPIYERMLDRAEAATLAWMDDLAHPAEPASPEVVVHYGGPMFFDPSDGTIVAKDEGDFSPGTAERVRLRRLPQRSLTVDPGPPVADDAVAYGGREYTLPRATSIADAALRGLPYEVDMREESGEVGRRWTASALEVAKRNESKATITVDAEGLHAWEKRKTAELRESLESEARRTLREWPTRAGVPLRLVVRGDEGLFTATWEE